MNRPQTTFQWAMERLANFERGQVLPITNKTAVEATDGTTRIMKVQGYTLQWIERIGPNPMDCIICSYKVVDPDDIKTLKDALDRRSKAEIAAKAHVLSKAH